MMCLKPFVQGVHGFPCGQCMPCRFNRRRLWTHRLILEQKDHAKSTFVTLTYDDQKYSGSTLVPEHLQLWLKKIRKAVHPEKLRYFAVGEYGDQSQRPHYHLALFGYGNCLRGQTRKAARCCQQCDLIADTWGFGHIYLGQLTTESAQYVAGYVTKKMTLKNDPRLQGRHPEFSRMSLRPGIGAGAADEIASTMLSHNLETSPADVPTSLRHGSRQLPLGRYLRRRLRLRIGRPENAPRDPVREAEMLALLQASLTDQEAPTLKSQLVKQDYQKMQSLIARSRIFKKRGSV